MSTRSSWWLWVLLTLLPIVTFAQGEEVEDVDDNPATCNANTLIGFGGSATFTVPEGCHFMKIKFRGSGGNSWAATTFGPVGGWGGGGAWARVIYYVVPGQTYTWTAGANTSYATPGGWGAPGRLIVGAPGVLNAGNALMIMGGGGGAGACTGNCVPGNGGVGGGQDGGNGTDGGGALGPAVAGFGALSNQGGAGGTGNPLCTDGGNGGGGFSQIMLSNGSSPGGDGGQGYYQGGGGQRCYHVPPGPLSPRIYGGGGGGGYTYIGNAGISIDWLTTLVEPGSGSWPGGLWDPEGVPFYGYGGEPAREVNAYLGGGPHIRINFDSDITFAESRMPNGTGSWSDACANVQTGGYAYGVQLTQHPCLNETMSCRIDEEGVGDAVCRYHCNNNSTTYVFRVDC